MIFSCPDEAQRLDRLEHFHLCGTVNRMAFEFGFIPLGDFSFDYIWCSLYLDGKFGRRQWNPSKMIDQSDWWEIEFARFCRCVYDIHNSLRSDDRFVADQAEIVEQFRYGLSDLQGRKLRRRPPRRKEAPEQSPGCSGGSTHSGGPPPADSKPGSPLRSRESPPEEPCLRPLFLPNQ